MRGLDEMVPHIMICHSEPKGGICWLLAAEFRLRGGADGPTLHSCWQIFSMNFSNTLCTKLTFAF